MNAKRETAESRALPLEERKALVAKWVETATGDAKEGAELIDFRDPSPKERAFAETLVERGRQALARARQRQAA
jgi:hypothetical protein